MGEYKKYRKHNKIYELPEWARKLLDDMLLDTSVSYTEIAVWLRNEGFDISRSTVGRYAMETNRLANRLMETQRELETLIKAVKSGDGENLTEAAMQISTHKLTEKIAMSDTEIDEMDITDAIKLMTSIARTKAYKDKIYAALKSDYDKAFERFMKLVDTELEGNPDLRDRLIEHANTTLGKVAV